MVAATNKGQQYYVSEFEVVASICRKSFYHFVLEFWDVINPEPIINNWHIKFLCDRVQEVMERIFAGVERESDEIINLPPGESKSTIYSVMLPAWAWTRMPHCRAICASHTSDLVLFLSRRTRDIVESTKYQRCFPKIELRDDQNNKGHFENTLGGFRFCCTVGGKTPTGMHSHILIVDDPLDPKKAIEEAGLKDANHFMTSVLPSRRINKKVSVIFLVMQRLHEDDPTGHLLAKGKLKLYHICLPAEYEPETTRPAFVRRFYARQHNLLDAQRLDAAVLANEKELMGDYDYAGQYGQTPTPPGGGMFKMTKQNIRIVDQDLRDKDFEWTVRYWDKAATEDAGCRTAGAKLGRRIIGMTNRVPATKGHPAIEPRPIYEYWIRHVEVGQWITDDREAVIYSTAITDGRDVHISQEREPGSSGKDSAEYTIGSLTGFSVDYDLPTGEKSVRWRALASQWNIGRVVIVKGDWNQLLLDEFKYALRGKFKDIKDACAGAFNRLSKGYVEVGAV